VVPSVAVHHTPGFHPRLVQRLFLPVVHGVDPRDIRTANHTRRTETIKIADVNNVFWAWFPPRGFPDSVDFGGGPVDRIRPLRSPDQSWGPRLVPTDLAGLRAPQCCAQWVRHVGR